MGEREARVTQNETTARDINEKIEQAHPSAQGEHFRIICECGDDRCSRVLAITVPEYEEIRHDPRHFAVARTHVMPDVEEVVRDTTRFTIVRKREGAPAQIAEEENPRP
jgi:hypothetical protein